MPLTVICRRGRQTRTVILPAWSGELPLATVQQMIDVYFAVYSQTGIYFIHDTASLLYLSEMPGRMGGICADFPADALFSQILRAGALLRKEFFMGTTIEKLYYLEAWPIIAEATRCFPFTRGRILH